MLLTLIVGEGALAQNDQKYAKWTYLRDQVQPRRESLMSASVLYDNTKWWAQSYMVPSRPEDVKKFLDDLAAIEKLMAGETEPIEVPPGANPKDIMYHPEAWLEIAKARNEIIAKLGLKAAEDKATAEVKFIKDITAKIKASDGWGLNENGLNIVLGKREDVRKKLCGGQKFPGWDEACDELVKTAKSMAATNRSYANHSNSWAEQQIRAGWAKNYKDRTIIKIAAAKSDWTVVKDAFGQPKYRSVGMSVRYKVAGFDYVIEQTVSMLQDYKGGSYVYRPTAQVPDYRIVK